MKVWIIETGEDCEGGQIVGVYATRDLAKAEFLDEAGSLCERFGEPGFDQALEDGEGSIYLHSGCVWLTLSNYEVKTQEAIGL